MRFPWQRKAPPVWRWEELARYNTRRSQGVMHTPEYVERMRQEQREFDLEHYGFDTAAERQNP